MSVRFRFDPEKALEALVYIVPRVGKLHLHRYGKFIAGDYYKALKYGPVPQGVYDILHYVEGAHSSSPAPHARAALRFKSATELVALREAELDALSKTDLECLDSSIAKHGKKPFWQLKKETHDAAYNATLKNQEIAVEAIAGMAQEGRREELLQYLSDRYPDRVLD
jgi:hypothetical protein